MQHSEYYQHLRALSPKGAGVLAAKLFHGTEWYTEGVLGLSSKSALKSKVATQVIPTDNSEKAQTIESLKKFANEKLEQTPGGKIAIPGGEVAVKEGASLRLRFNRHKSYWIGPLKSLKLFSLVSLQNLEELTKMKI